ncbi:MAG: WD40 repeat domain-containing protein, partial [bacterium]|nr:WD40 repeat domain-containing protein [bacterium]
VAYWGTRDASYKLLTDLGARVLPLVFSPNGRYLLTASQAGEIIIWNRNRTRNRTRAGAAQAFTQTAQVQHLDGLRSARFSPDSERILYATDDGTARIWTPESGEMVDLSAPMPQHETQTPIEDAVFSRNGQFVLTRTQFTVRLWDDDGNLLQQLEHDISGIVKIAFTPDQRVLVTTATHATIWQESDDGEYVPINRVPAREGAFTDATFIYHQDSLASRICFSMQGGTASIYYPIDEQLVPSLHIRMHDLEFRTRQLSDPNYARGQHEYLTWSADGTAKLWDIDAPQRGFARRMVFPVDQISFGPHPHGFTGGTTTIAGLFPGHTTLLSQGEQIGDPLFRNKMPISERFLGTSPLRDRVITTASDHTIHIWNKDTDRLHTLVGHRHEVADAQFSPDQSKLASLSLGAHSAEIRVWTLATNQSAEGSQPKGTSLAWHPEGQILATGTSSGHLRLWNLQGEVTATIQVSGSPINALRFRPDGRIIYAGCDDGSLLLFQTDKPGTAPTRIPCHSGKISCLEISPNGQFIASCSHDGTARLASQDGREICILRGHRGPVTGLAFDAHSDRLATCGSDGFIYFWLLDP